MSESDPIHPPSGYWQTRSLVFYAIVAGVICFAIAGLAILMIGTPAESTSLVFLLPSMLFALIGFVSMLVYGAAYIRFVRWRCPACGEAIHSTLMGSLPFSKSCVHCGRRIARNK